MDLENIFRDVKLGKTEMIVLRSIQNDPEQHIRQRVRAVTERCYSNPSPLARLVKELESSGWLEPVYFIRFNITMSKLGVTNDIDYMSVQSEEALTLLLANLKQQRILVHGNGFSRLIAQYICNKFLVTGVNASLALWPDCEILEQKNAVCFDSVWAISKFERSGSALNWVKVLEEEEINLVCFTGDYQSPLAQTTDTAFTIHNPQRFDDDIYWSNLFFGYCTLDFERLLKMWSTSLRSNGQSPLSAMRAGGVPGQRLAPCPDCRVIWQFCRGATHV